ncbi:MAG: porphobilinogen synthase [Bacteroidetes bacterium]|nr:porphobilinogen synthase [Bacteroidota bacterium]
MPYPTRRNRINRANHAIRELVAETQLSASDFIAPLFITEGQGVKDEISSMPGYYRFSLDLLKQELEELVAAGIQSVLLFVKVPDELKDNAGTEALNPNGLMQRSIRMIKTEFPPLLVMTDVALDPYSSYGHDGIVEKEEIVNDATVEVLVKMALSHVQAGADWVAPSDMMDGRIGAIREAFNRAGYENKGILAYTAKYASNLYGPFRDALDSAPGFGDKKTYQMDFRNSREALLEAQEDSAEGADMLMVKPGIFYLDIVQRMAQSSLLPIAVYQVSGEYAMIQAAGAKGWINREAVMMESLISFKRAGAKIILTYFAKEAANSLKSNA